MTEHVQPTPEQLRDLTVTFLRDDVAGHDLVMRFDDDADHPMAGCEVAMRLEDDEAGDVAGHASGYKFFDPEADDVTGHLQFLRPIPPDVMPGDGEIVARIYRVDRDTGDDDVVGHAR